MRNDADVLAWSKRVEAEYREMPGLQLTASQIRRMWGLDAATCAAVIAALVGAGVLVETAGHGYALLSLLTRGSVY